MGIWDKEMTRTTNASPSGAPNYLQVYTLHRWNIQRGDLKTYIRIACWTLKTIRTRIFPQVNWKIWRRNWHQNHSKEISAKIITENFPSKSYRKAFHQNHPEEIWIKMLLDKSIKNTPERLYQDHLQDFSSKSFQKSLHQNYSGKVLIKIIF